MAALMKNFFQTSPEDNVQMADLRTPVSGISPSHEQIQQQISVYKATIAPLKTSLDMLQESVSRMQIEPSMETRVAVDKIQAGIENYKATHEDLRVIEDGLEAALRDQVADMIQKLVDEGVAKHIDECVKQQVKNRLKPHKLTRFAMGKLNETEEDLKRLQIDLHNSESKRLNAQLAKGEDDDEPVQTLIKPDGTISANFPKTFKQLYNLTPAAAKALLQEYGVQEPTSNDYRMVNKFMYFIGASYQLVRR